MSPQLEFLSVGSNRVANCLDWAQHPAQENVSWVIYGANIGVGLIKITRKVNENEDVNLVDVLKGHSNRVNAVKFIRNSKRDQAGSILLWAYKAENDSFQRIGENKAGHGASITSCSQWNDWICSTSIDGTTRLWSIQFNENSMSDIILQQTIEYKFRYMLCSAMIGFNKGQIMLAVGGTDFKIYIYLVDELRKELLPIVTLPGHEDWVRSLSLTSQPDSNHLLLASGGQDTTIRLWRVQPNTANHDASVTQLSTTTHLFNITRDMEKERWEVGLESVLLGHDGWIYSLAWNHTGTQLLSSSADQSIVLWEPDHVHANGVWLNQHQLGLLGGSTSLGFYGVKFHPSEKLREIVAVGYKGALHHWRYSADQQWGAIPFLSGHTGSVTGLDWDPQLPYLITCSSDQTTRAFAPTNTNLTWREIGRPQIHGYDLRRVKFIEPYRFACIGEEKVLRVLDAPKSFLTRLFNLVPNINSHHNRLSQLSDRPDSATLPALGLSNKAVTTSDNNANNDDTLVLLSTDDNVNELQLPFEEELQQSTLWPELDKIYGHGYELIALDSSPDHKFIVTTCKATHQQYTGLQIVPTHNLQPYPLLPGQHQLTVTCLAFSTNSKFLVAGSRDRSISVYKKADNTYELLNKINQPHSRIIWDVQFSPSIDSTDDSVIFATGSRDKSVKVWKIVQEEITLLSTITVDEPVTALAFDPRPIDQGRKTRLAVGLESGAIGLGVNELINDQWKIHEWIDNRYTPAASINEMKFQPITTSTKLQDPTNNSNQLSEANRLAVAAVDHSLRIYAIPPSS